MDFFTEYWPYAAALLPTVGVAFLFYWVIRYMIEADRSERKALARWNVERREAEGATAPDAAEREQNGGDERHEPDQSPENSPHS